LSKNTGRKTSTSTRSTASSESQSAKFERAAREHGADEDEERWNERIRQLAKHRVVPEIEGPLKKQKPGKSS
jgi:hypothetical protein